MIHSSQGLVGQACTIHEGSINAQANAAFIVLACNNHEALVEAAKAVLPTLEQSFLYLRNESLAHQVVNAARQLRAAIAAVEGRTE